MRISFLSFREIQVAKFLLPKKMSGENKIQQELGFMFCRAIQMLSFKKWMLLL